MRTFSLSKILSSGLFVSLMLVMLLIIEGLTFYSLNNGGCTLELVCCGWALLLVVFVIGLLTGVYKPDTKIARRLLTNSVSHKWLSLVFVLGFLIHITWFIDTGFSVVIEGEYDLWLQWLILLFGLCLNLFFVPKAENKSHTEKSERTLLFTGMSSTKDKERLLKLLLKPFLDVAGYENIIKVIIMKSTSLDEGSEEEMRSLLFEELKSKPTEYSKYSDRPPEIIFTSESYDYNDVKDCYVGLEALLKRYEGGGKGGTTQTLIHINPGTTAITAAMSLCAVKGSRAMVYTAQNTELPTEVNINVWDVENLLKELINEIEE
jgi:hypothetical protein